MTERPADLVSATERLGDAALQSTSAASADVESVGTAVQDARAEDEQWFPRLIGVLILGLAGAGAVLMLLATLATGPAAGVAPTRGFLFGVWSVLYATEAPTPRVAVAAVGLAVLFAAGVALLERRITNQSRRSVNIGTHPLAPKLVMARTQGAFAGPVTVTVLIPATTNRLPCRRRSRRWSDSRTARNGSSSSRTTAPTPRSRSPAEPASRSSSRSATFTRRRAH